MIGSLALGAFVFQTVLVVGGPGSAKTPGYDPILHIVSSREAPSIEAATGRGGVKLRIAGKKASTARRVPRAAAASRQGVRILDASTRTPKARQALPQSRLDAELTGRGTRIGRSLETAEERRIILPLIRRLQKAEWHLGRGTRQARTDLKTQGALDSAVREFRGTSMGLTLLLQRYKSSSRLAGILQQVKALVDEGRLQAWMAQARLQLRRSSARGADRWIQRAYRSDPHNPELLLLKARVDGLLGKPRR